MTGLSRIGVRAVAWKSPSKMGEGAPTQVKSPALRTTGIASPHLTGSTAHATNRISLTGTAQSTTLAALASRNYRAEVAAI